MLGGWGRLSWVDWFMDMSCLTKIMGFLFEADQPLPIRLQFHRSDMSS